MLRSLRQWISEIFEHFFFDLSLGSRGEKKCAPHRQTEMRDNKGVSKGRSKSSRRTKAKSISLSATSLCCKHRTRALGGELSKFRSPANCMPRRAVVRSPSEESEHDTLVERGSMVGKQGVSLALDPTQFIFIKFTNILSFWFPFQQDDPVRRIDVYADDWNTYRAFDCVFLPPIFRGAIQTVCYNGGSMQTFHLILKDRKLVALKTSAGYQSDAMPPKNTFETMAEVFLAYVQSAALFWRNGLSAEELQNVRFHILVLVVRQLFHTLRTCMICLIYIHSLVHIIDILVVETSETLRSFICGLWSFGALLWGWLCGVCDMVFWMPCHVRLQWVRQGSSKSLQLDVWMRSNQPCTQQDTCMHLQCKVHVCTLDWMHGCAAAALRPV